MMSGLVPLGQDIMRYLNTTSVQLMHEQEYWWYMQIDADKLFHYRSEIALQTLSFGADVHAKVSRRVTHVVTSTSRTRTHKVRQAAKYPHIKIVNQHWLINSMSKWAKEDETPYLVEIHEQDRQPPIETSSVPSIHSDEERESEYESGLSDDEDDSIHNSQEQLDEDEDGVMPDEIEAGHSPIDDLKHFDWDNADAELAEFMGSDSENDSDTGSVASDTSRASRSSHKSATIVERKRKYDEATEDDDSDEESTLAKKQRIANSRTTGLKTVKTPNSVGSESSLPTPGMTADEKDEVDQIPAGDELEDDDDDDLEKEMMAEFEREEREEALSAMGDGDEG